MNFLALLCFLTGVTYVASMTFGFDTVEYTPKTTFKCLKNKGYKNFIGRVFDSKGALDTTGLMNIYNARSAGMSEVDGYVMPCMGGSCSSGKVQVIETINKLRTLGTNVDKIWIDVENLPTQRYSIMKNRETITDMVRTAEEFGVKAGIYTNSDTWQSVVGTDWNAMKDLPLWYSGNTRVSVSEVQSPLVEQTALKENVKFSSFGGWTRPEVYQYKVSSEGQGPCGMQSMDMNLF